MAKTKPTPKGPQVQDFLDKQKVARNAAETVQRQVREGYDAAQASTRQPGDRYDRLDLLDTDATRSKFKSTLESTLVAPYAGAVAAMPDDPDIAKTLVLNGALGFGPTEASGIVDAMKSNLTYSGFMDVLGKNTDWQKALERRLSIPGTILDQVSAADVAGYAGIKPKSPDKMTLRDKAELIGAFEQFGIVPPKLLKDKPYMI